jgi:outer membrane protein TolC
MRERSWIRSPLWARSALAATFLAGIFFSGVGLPAVDAQARAQAQTPEQESSSDDPRLEELTVATTVRRALDSDPGIRSSRYRTMQARERYNRSVSGIRPRAELEVRPYTFDQRRIPGAGAGPGAGEVASHSVGLGLNLVQPLTTGGSLSAGIDHTLRRFDPEEGDSSWEQIPELSFALNQPLMTGDQLVGTRVFRAGLRDAEIDFLQAELLNSATRGTAIREALALYVQVDSLRRSATLLEETISLLQRQLESAELDRRQGLISDTALLALQVTLNNRREALFSTRLQLVQSEQALARSIGLETVEGVPLETDLNSLSIPALQDLDLAIRENPRVQVQELQVEQARQRSIVNTRVDRPSIGFFARMQPLYPEPRDDGDSLSNSFTDLFSNDAGLEATVGFALNVPLLVARQRQYRERIDELTRLNAQVELDDTEQILANNLRTLLTNRRFLQERLSLLDVDVEYEQRRTDSERTLLAAGVTTELRVREVELDLSARLNERQRISAELFLNSVDILNVLGEDLELLFRGQE